MKEKTAIKRAKMLAEAYAEPCYVYYLNGKFYTTICPDYVSSLYGAMQLDIRHKIYP